MSAPLDSSFDPLATGRVLRVVHYVPVMMFLTQFQLAQDWFRGVTYVKRKFLKNCLQMIHE